MRATRGYILRSWLVALLILTALALPSPAVRAASFVVTTVADDPDVTPGDGVCATAATPGAPCSLRAAIQEANAAPGKDVISFNIPGSGVRTIRPSTALPYVTDAVIIDGYTQPGARANTDPVAFNATLLIELDGSLIQNVGHGLIDANGLMLISGDNIIRGLVINRFGNGVTNSPPQGQQIQIREPGGNTIQGNIIGVDPSGSQLLSTPQFGVPITFGMMLSAPNNLVGGAQPSERNLISGMTIGLAVGGGNNRIVGNLIGTDHTGTRSLGSYYGIDIGTPGNVIGGERPGERNVISGNHSSGIHVQVSGPWDPGATPNRVVGNAIGLGATGAPLGNTPFGIMIVDKSPTHVGGSTPSEANDIAHNDIGVIVEDQSPVRGDTNRNTLANNRFFGNTRIGIDLSSFNGFGAVTPNDPGDADDGSNRLQNFPEISAAHSSSSRLTVSGALDSEPSVRFLLTFYASGACAPSGFGEGEIILGTHSVTTDAAGHAGFSAELPFPQPAKRIITATATHADGSTSEFSRCVAAGEQTVTPVPTVTPPTSPAPPSADDDDDDDEDRRPRTEEQRQQRERTNAGNKDDVYTEGNVVALHLDEQPPAVTIANRDGLQRVRLLCGVQCPRIQIGDYLEADGEKHSEGLFDATDISVGR